MIAGVALPMDGSEGGGGGEGWKHYSTAIQMRACCAVDGGNRDAVGSASSSSIIRITIRIRIMRQEALLQCLYLLQRDLHGFFKRKL